MVLADTKPLSSREYVSPTFEHAADKPSVKSREGTVSSIEEVGILEVDGGFFETKNGNGCVPVLTACEEHV